jgi:hypothetical protein
VQGAKGDSGEPVELARSDLRGIVLLILPGVLAVAVVILIGLSALLTLLFALGFLLVFALPIIALRWFAGRNAIFADDKGLIEVVRGRARRAADWEQIRDASWYAGTLWLAWDPGGIVVTTDAGGSRVGTIVIVRSRARAETGERVIAYLTARLSADHGAE